MGASRWAALLPREDSGNMIAKQVLAPLALAAMIMAAVFVAWESHDDVVREDEGNFVMSADTHSHNKKDAIFGQLKVGGGWCLHAPKQTMETQLTIAKCANTKQQHWVFQQKTGLVQLKAGGLCVHADYVSEPEGALTSLQPCNAKSERQTFTLDKKSQTLQLQQSPHLCVHSVDAKRRIGQPVLIMPCHENLLDLGEETATQVQPLATNPSVDRILKKANDDVKVSSAVDAKVPKVLDAAVPKMPKKVPTVSTEDFTKEFSSKSKDGALSSALSRIDSAMTLYHQQSAAIKVKAEKAEHAAKGKPKQLKKAKVQAAKELQQVEMQHTATLKSTISQLQSHFDETAKKAHQVSAKVKKSAQARAKQLTTDAKKRASLAVAQARKQLKEVLQSSRMTLRKSTEERQRARNHLVQLRSKKSPDEVEVAEAALNLAKINKATHAANIKAHRATRLASSLASKRIQFANTMLASRLKAIRGTQHLSTDKAALKAQSLIAEAQESLLTAKQQVLMSFHGAVDRMNLDEIVGKKTMVPLSSHKLQPQHSIASRAAVQEFDGDIEQNNVVGRNLQDQDLVDSHASALTRAPEDEIYTQKMKTCSFPYKYNGQKMFRCKMSKKGHWCATKVDANLKIQEWDYCVLDKRAVTLAKQAAMEAATIEIKRMLASTGAKITPAALRESLRAAAAAQQVPGTKKSGSAGKAALAKKRLAAGKRSMNSAQAKAKVDQMIKQHSKKMAQP